MKNALSLCFFLTAASTGFGVAIGDTYDQVISEKGVPGGKLELGEVLLLNYPGQAIRLEKGKVISVKSVSAAQTPPAAIKAAPAKRPPAVVAKPTSAAPSVAEIAWSTDYTGALAQAKEQNRHTFLFFTGSDWCGWCMKLDREILSTAEFKRYAGENLVLVKLDFPQKIMLSSELIAQNRLLAKRYNVEGFPTIMVLDSSGHAVKRLGYQAGGPSPFIAALQAL